MFKLYCDYCEEEIEDDEYYIDESQSGSKYIHKDCIREYADEVWDDLNLTEKLDLLNITENKEAKL